LIKAEDFFTGWKVVEENKVDVFPSESGDFIRVMEYRTRREGIKHLFEECVEWKIGRI
jgi:hypothetical protein